MPANQQRHDLSNGRLDIEDKQALISYLRATGRIEPDELPICRRLRGGVSNRTVLIERKNGTSWVLKQSLARLRVPVEWFSDLVRVHREALGMQWLATVLPTGAVPAFLFEDRENHLVAMEAVPPPNPTWKQLLLEGELVEEHVVEFARILATIHRESGKRLESLPALFKDRSNFESLRLEPFYRYTGTMAPCTAGFMERLEESVVRHRLTLVHADYSPKNILIHNERLVLLDHESIHVGDPAFDIGFSTTHLLSKGHHLAAMRHEFEAAAVTYWETYRALVGDQPWFEGLEARSVLHTLGCLAARAAGRSKLEYLDDPQRRAQLEHACTLMSDVPEGMPSLIRRFLREI